MFSTHAIMALRECIEFVQNNALSKVSARPEREIDRMKETEKGPRFQRITVQGQYLDQACALLGMFPKKLEYWMANRDRLQYVAQLMSNEKPFGETAIIKVNGKDPKPAKERKRRIVSAEELEAKKAREAIRKAEMALFASLNVAVSKLGVGDRVVPSFDTLESVAHIDMLSA